ncbi:eCIS core domain-containing protein [Nannocystis punicea]|uniref:DUF4157 domain-containing protein n=1 Tax=Nannocystis punicea TaxID=2995304 RepID=A0ABY7HC87_9BACT|nr:DUF4157 domain-containing protein [Nannocystis poenicansa]WAS96883.1 DUF4157 domain-containing protein [Nannocystis poenicansa]
MGGTPASTINVPKGRDGRPPIRVYEGPAADWAAVRIGAYGYSLGGDIVLGPGLGQPGRPSRDVVLRHEMRHALQARNPGPRAHAAALEAEAHNPSISLPQLTAADDELLGFWWVAPLAAGLYVLLRPSVANAPGPKDRAQPRVSELQVAGEALSIFAVPVGVTSALGRMGFGVIGSFALAGAGSSTTYRGLGDIGRGSFSGVEAYVVDAGVGALIGVVVGGVFRSFGGMLTAIHEPTPPLVHLTDTAGKTGITASGVLRQSQGIYAVPAKTVSEGTALRVFRTLLRPSRTAHPIPIPEGSGGLFSQPLPIGPISTYQRLVGVYRAPAGAIELATGSFTPSTNSLANITGQFWPYVSTL